MKIKRYLIVLFLAAGLLTCTATIILACGGDGNQSEPQGTGIKSNGSYNSASSGVTFDRDQEYVFMNWYTNNRIEEDRMWLVFFQRTEKTVDVATFTANVSILSYSAYCWKIGKAGIFFPISMVWQVSKLSSRALYGATTGNMNTVKKLNEQSWTGRRANELINLITGEAK